MFISTATRYIWLLAEIIHWKLRILTTTIRREYKIKHEKRVIYRLLLIHDWHAVGSEFKIWNAGCTVVDRTARQILLLSRISTNNFIAWTQKSETDVPLRMSYVSVYRRIYGLYVIKLILISIIARLWCHGVMGSNEIAADVDKIFLLEAVWGRLVFWLVSAGR